MSGGGCFHGGETDETPGMEVPCDFGMAEAKAEFENTQTTEVVATILDLIQLAAAVSTSRM